MFKSIALSLAFWLFASLLMLQGCGYDDPASPQTAQGVQVTATVPHSTESAEDIINRGGYEPMPDHTAPDPYIYQCHTDTECEEEEALRQYAFELELDRAEGEQE